MITSLALSLIAIASGTLLTYTYDEGAPLASRLSSGACLGFAAMALVGFVCALLFGLNPSTIGFTAALLLLPVLLLKSRPIRNQIDQDINQALKAISRASSKPDRWAFIYFLFYAGVAIVMSGFITSPISARRLDPPAPLSASSLSSATLQRERRAILMATQSSSLSKACGTARWFGTPRG